MATGRALRWPCIAAVVLTLAHGAPAAASPFEDSTLGGAVFTGPTHPHASAIHVNPAAMGLVAAGWHAYLGGSLQLDQMSVDQQTIDVDSGATGDGPSAQSLTATPSGMLAAYWRSRTAAIGVATYTPQAERFHRDVEEWRYQVLGGHHYQWTVFALSVAFRWNRFWMGVGVGLGNMQSMRLRFARDVALEAGTAGIETTCPDGNPCGVGNDAATQRYRVDVASNGLRPLSLGFFGSLFSSENLSLNAGAIFQATEDWLLAFSYQGSVGLFGGSRRLSGDVEVDTAEIEGGMRRVGRAEIGYTLPETLNLAARGPILDRNHELVAAVRWQTFFTHDELDVRMFGGELAGHDIPEQYPLYRGFQSVFGASVGLERAIGAPFRYGARVGFERGAVATAEVTPLAAAGHNLRLGGGVEWRLGASLVLGAGYDLSWFPPMEASVDAFDPRDRIACVDSGYRLDMCEAVREGRARPTAAGSYRRFLHTFNTSLRWDFL